MAMVNPALFNHQVKDTQWLTLEVCREFTRNKCTRTETECKFAHPPSHVEFQNGRVTCCFDSLKGKCQRKDPPCKYLHPPQHLREQLLQNGRNNLIFRNMQIQQAAWPPGMHQATVMPIQTMAHPYLTAMPNNPASHHLYTLGPTATSLAMAPHMQTLENGNAVAAAAAAQQSQQVQIMNAANPAPQKMTTARPIDRLEQPATTSSSTSSSVTGSNEALWTGGSYADSVVPTSQYSHIYLQPQVVEVLTGKKRPRDPADDFILSMPGMVPMMKRPTMDKSGIAMYQAAAASNPVSAAAYHQAAALHAMHLQQQQFAPVTIAGHPPSMQRF